MEQEKVVEQEAEVTAGTSGESRGGRKRRPFFPLPRPKCGYKAKLGVIILVILVALLAVAYRYQGVFIAAVVDGTPISRLAIVRTIEARAGKDALDTLISETLIRNAAVKAGILVADEAIAAEMQKIEQQVGTQGMTLEEALAAQGMTKEEVMDRIRLREELKLLLAESIAVSDDEVNDYLAKTKRTPEAGSSSEDLVADTRELLMNQKFSAEADKWVTTAKEKAKITYFVEY